MASHMDRLSSVDASFLAQEREGSHMHIGGVMIFEGPAPGREEFARGLEARLHLVPRYRQKLSFPRFEMGRPLWVDDPSFNLGYHVRHTALPEPGSVEQLRLLAGRIFSQRLDRSKPLWELWLVEGFEGDKFAIINKTHHALVDGVSGADLTTVLFDLSRDGTDVPPPGREWTPAPEPSDADLVAKGVADIAATPVDLARQAAGALSSPRETAGRAREALAGVGEVAWGRLNGAPQTPLNGPIGPHRRVTWARVSLSDLKEVKNELGGTVNDVFLAIVTGALHRWLHDRGIRTEGLEVRSAVPVSIRAEGAGGELGNQITIMVGRLPTYVDDPVERLRVVTEQMQGLKESKQALGAEVIASIEDFAPPTIFARASRLHFSTRIYNLLTTNVPGPQFPLYLLGRELLELIPVAFLAPEQRLAVACMSYNGWVAFSLIGDYDAMPDLERLADHVVDETAALREAARPGRMPAAR
jgi:diacylglycerol O-acyltransferase / wax synthase